MCMRMRRERVFPVILIVILCIMTVPCIAIEPDWKYTDEKITIGDVVVSPDGSSVIAAAGKVLLLSRDGKILAKEPYGETIHQSGNGNIIVSSYSSVVASTMYVFKKTTDVTGIPVLKKQWEITLANKIDDLAVSGKGDRVALTAGGVGVHVYDGDSGNLLGHSDAYSSKIAMSERGNVIAGISFVEGLKLYTSKGALRKKFDVGLVGQTTYFLMGSDGNTVVFNTGPFIMAYNITSGSELWKKRTSGDVSMIAMTPPGNRIIAGTENGAVECYDSNGTLSWIYNSDNSSESGHAVTAVALSGDGSTIIAGTDDGKVLFLGPDGTILGSFDEGQDSIHHVAIASGGSLAVAAGDHTLIGFTSGLQNITTRETMTTSPLISRTFPSAGYPVGQDVPPPVQTTAIRTPYRVTVPDTPSVTITEYSVIRKATKGPVNDLFTIICIATLVLCAGIFAKRE